MARHPHQALYICQDCDGAAHSECETCGGSGYLLWEDLDEEEQAVVEARWYGPDAEEDVA